MAKLHELLAVEKTRTSASNKILTESTQKFGKIDYFQGAFKTLKMLEDSPTNTAIETAAAESRALPTTVQETLEYFFDFWAKAEDVIFQKNLTNQTAMSDLLFRGNVIATNVPVDELMGIEVRLEQIRQLASQMPTLPATVNVSPYPESGRKGAWIGEPEQTTKTEKTLVPVVLYEATDKHPAQVKESSTDKTVGLFKLTKVYGSATSLQKADVIAVLDDLIAETKQARMRANSVDAVTGTIGKKIADLILAPLRA